MKLKNRRLLAIAELLEGYTSIADIGADHGKLSVYAMKNNIVQKVIATDISSLSLQKTGQLAEKYNVSIDLRVGDGLSPLTAHEVDCVVIAGMGGHEIVKILKDRVKDFDNYILLPHKNAQVLRSFLKNNDIGISIDKVICEGKFFYHMITCNVKESWRSTDNIYIGTSNSLEQLDFVKYLRYKINDLDKLIQKSKGNTSYIEEKKELCKWILQ